MDLYTTLSTILVFNLVATSIYLLNTKTQSAKMLITLLLSTTGIGVIFLLYAKTKHDSILDIALIFVLLSSVTAIVFAKRLRYKKGDDE